ncbi:MAG: zf-HC2 domain-containing protein [Planctomycetes bacterium]|nr:zf-HC2 domain-containing protein [Planctomycetota bacterium]
MRSCEDFEKLLPAYVAGVADPVDMADIGEHLAECSPCMNDFQRVVRDLGTLKSWRDAIPPEGLAAGVLEKLASTEDQRRREALGEETSWGEPIQRALTWVMLGAVGLVVLATLVTAQSAVQYESQRRVCADNLRLIGEAAISEGEFQGPLEPRLRKLRKSLDRSIRECPLGPPLVDETPVTLPNGEQVSPPKKAELFSNYSLALRGPHYLAGDDRRNHSSDPGHQTMGPDANILLSDGSVISVTPAQSVLWELLDPYSPGR